VVLHHEQPSVSFRLLVRAGAMQEPDDKPGVASFAAGLLNQGTKTRSAGDLANSIESAGGLVGVGSGNELSFISGAVIKDRTDLMLSLAADMVQNPAFAQDEMDRRRSQILSSLDVSYDDPDYLASPCSTGWCSASIPMAGRRKARANPSAASPVTISSRSIAPGSSRTTRCWRSSGT
jgi:predicted Zn-dependent peptidase